MTPAGLHVSRSHQAAQPGLISPQGRASRARGRLVLAPGVLLAGCVALIGGTVLAPPAAAVPIDFSVSFPDLVPGEVRTESGEASVAVTAVVEQVEWVRTEGLLAAADLDVAVCDIRGCVSSADLVGTTIPAGTIDLRITVHAPEAIEPGTQGSALGRLSIVAADQKLAATGSPLTRVLVWAGALLLACGTLLTVGAVAHRLAPGRRSGAS